MTFFFFLYRDVNVNMFLPLRGSNVQTDCVYLFLFCFGGQRERITRRSVEAPWVWDEGRNVSVPLWTILGRGGLFWVHPLAIVGATSCSKRETALH